MKGITIALHVQMSQPYVFTVCSYTNDDQIMIIIPIPHRPLNDINLAMHW